MSNEEIKAIKDIFDFHKEQILSQFWSKPKTDVPDMNVGDTISRQAAIDAVWDGTNYDIYTREVKELLEQLPSAELATDCISRQAAVDILMKEWKAYKDYPYVSHVRHGLEIAIAILDNKVPSAQAKLDENDMPEQGDSAKFGVKTGETCTDCISRQDAIDALAYFEEKSPTGRTAQEVVKALPSAQRTGRCIPVSEKLPEEAYGTVLVCMPDESPYNEREQFINAKHNQQVETAHYSQYSDTWYFAMGAVSETRPIAWMPMPEPYTEDSE